MAISTVFIDGNEYFRITRTWNYKMTEVQRYVRIKKSRAKAKKEAEQIDESLKVRQIAARNLKKLNGEIYFHPTGKVVGVNRVFNSNGKYPPQNEHIFTIRYNPRNGQTPKHTTVSIERYGLRGAYEIAIDKLCIMANISNKNPLKRLMLDSFKYYSFDPTLKCNQNYINARGKGDPNERILEERLSIDFADSGEKFGLGDLKKIESNLLADLEDYQRKNPVPKKHQRRNISQW